MKNYAGRENCDSRAWRISTLDMWNKNILRIFCVCKIQDYTVELSGSGFRIVGPAHDDISLKDVPNIEEEFETFETPYSLLESISPKYTQTFGDCLAQKLQLLQD